MNTCSSYANSLNIVFSSRKSTGLLLSPKKFNLSCDPVVRLGSDCTIFSNGVSYLGQRWRKHFLSGGEGGRLNQ